MHKLRPLLVVVAASVLGLLSACLAGPATISPLYDRLSGRGPIVLGDDNPYLPANAFFQEQRRGSPELARFVREQGEPTAVSLERKLYKKTRLGLYYPERGTVFFFARGLDDWAPTDSQEISPDERQSLSIQLAQSGRVVQATKTQEPVAAIQPSPTELRGRLRPPGTAEEARLTRLPDGSYQHRVTFPGETLRVLAEWYAEDSGQAPVLAAASGRSAQQPLRIGDKVTIPKRLMRNVHPLPEAAIP